MCSEVEKSAIAAIVKHLGLNKCLYCRIKISFLSKIIVFLSEIKNKRFLSKISFSL